MKKSNSLIITSFSILLICIVFISCSNNNEDKTEVTSEKSMETILKDISKIAESEGKIVTFNVSYNNGQFTKSNVQIIKNSQFVNDFANTFNKGETELERKRVTITCSNGTNITCNSNDGACVGHAVKACLDAGGCAEVCNANLTYIPKNLH